MIAHTKEWYDDDLVSKSPLWHTSSVLKTKQNKNYSTNIYAEHKNWTSFCYDIKMCVLQCIPLQAHAVDDFSIIVPLLNFVVHRNLKVRPLLMQSIRCTRSMNKQKNNSNECYRNHFLRLYLSAICWICFWLKAGRAASCKWWWWRWLNAIIFRLYEYDDDATM